MKEIEDVKAELKTSLDIMNSQRVDLKLPVMSTSSKASSSSANPKKFDYENKEEHVINTYNYELKALSNYFHLHTKQSAEKLKELTDKVTFLSNELANQNSFIIRVLSNKS
jgi:small-conductance mechanosensitive channel